MNKIILGLAGEIASGKGTTAKYICEKHSGNSHRFSTALRDVAKRMYLEENRENLQKISTIFREAFFSDILSAVIAKDVESDKHEIIVIDGVRRLADIAYLEKLPGFKLVYIEADMKKRYERIIQRGENSDDKTKTFEEFQKDHEREAEREIRDLKNKAAFVIDNNGNFEDLYKQIDEIIGGKNKMENILKKHTVVNLSSGGFVLVLNTESKIDGQAEAMLQALHSRSTGGIKHHLQMLEEKGAENFMEQFYVGYGHKSIGDCGSATVFVEGISMLAAKAIQDWRLYSGQEASTRYVDFSEQKFLDPTNSKEGEEILEGWRKFYLEAQEPVRKHLKKQFPKNDDEDEKIYEKAIKARAFDVTRSFLPAGATTNIAWRMNFRQLADEIMMLRHHPLAEVRDIAEKSEEALRKMYPSSFCHERFPKTEEYNKKWMREGYYYKNDEAEDFRLVYDNIDRKILANYKNILESRPMKTELPVAIGECGVVAYEFLLDFGSFRDLQRHRAVVQRMPLLVRTHGFNKWYLDALPKELKEKTEEFIKQQEEKIKKLNISEEDAQYFTAMGYQVPCRFSGDLKSLVYMAELRSTRFVHPTLVEQTLKMIKSLKELFEKDGLVLHLDDEPNRFDVKRGEQDIAEK